MATKTVRVRSLANTPMELSHSVEVARPSDGMTSRSRPTSSGRLPAIQYEPDGPAYMTPRAAPDTRTASRIEFLEDRLQHQERTTQGLLDRAFRIKEDIIDNLNIQQGTWQEEKQARGLLQEHIRTITDVVRKLSRDIQQVEGQIHNREQALSGTNDSVKTLELHHVAGVTDLRGRVARCDASISRLAADLKACYDSVKSVSQQQQENHGKLMDRLGHTENRVSDLFNRSDKQMTEQTLHIQRLETELGRQIGSVEGRAKSMNEEVKGRIVTEKQFSHGEREKLEARVLNTVERALGVRDTRYDQYEKKTDEVLRSHQGKIVQLEEQFVKEREKNNAVIQALEAKLNSVLEVHIRKQQDELKRLKAECREGFSTVHESISNMKQVMDGKRKLLEEQLRKEIGQIRKMVVLI